MNQECQQLFFRLRETSFSLMELSRNPGNYLKLMLLFIHPHYVLNYRIFYDLSAQSPQSLSAKSVFISYWLWKEMENFFNYANHIPYDWWKSVSKQRNFVFLTQTNSLENIFEATKEFTNTLLSVKIAADQLINCPSLFAESSLSNR